MGLYERRNGAWVRTSGGSVVDENQYELIDTITIEEEISDLLITTEPDGTPYSFSKILMITHMLPAAEDGGIMNVWYDSDAKFLLTGSGFVAKREKHGQLKAWIENGKAYGLACIAANSQSEIMNAYLPAAGRLNHNLDRFYKLQIKTSVPMPVGSTIEIWAIRS